MTITEITSVSQLNGILDKSKEKLSVIDFHATWCGPCHAIAPTYEALSKQYINVNFLKCDVDAAAEVARLYSVSAMPTFVFTKGSRKVDQVRGANKSGLENALRTHSSASSSSHSGAFSGRGRTLGGSSPATSNNRTISLNLDPQLKILLGLVGAYLVLWYLS